MMWGEKWIDLSGEEARVLQKIAEELEQHR